MTEDAPRSAADADMQESLHLLVRNYEALEQTIMRLLNSDPQFGPWHPFQDRRDRSLSMVLDLKLKTHTLSNVQIIRILTLLVREFDRYGTVLQNLFAAMHRHEPLRLHRQPEDLNQLIEEVIDIFEGAAAERGIEIRLNTSGEAILLIDRHMMFRALMNVVDNAVKYSYSSSDRAPSRHIDVRSRRHTPQGDWIISVESYGVGVLPEELASGAIFEYGQRGRLAHDRYRSGTGIGLSEARRIVDAHGGRMRFDSRPLHGAYLTTVSIELNR